MEDILCECCRKKLAIMDQGIYSIKGRSELRFNQNFLSIKCSRCGANLTRKVSL